jgi:hypothetical protein
MVVNDGRDGAPPARLRLVGPGRVPLRYPCQARLDGASLTVAHTSQRPCDRGLVLTIAEGASVRFIGTIVGAQSGAERLAGGDARADPTKQSSGESAQLASQADGETK